MLSGAKRRHVRLGAASLTLGGAAFALIQILQGTIGAFSPRPIVSVLLAVSVALAGSTLGRLRQHGVQERRFAGLLRFWPLVRIRDSDGLALGVFPGRPLDGAGEARASDPPRSSTAPESGFSVSPGSAPLVQGSLPPYVAREVDAALRDAMGAGGFILVVGPERAGKSRTTFEAARAVLGDRLVVVPIAGAALGSLADEAWAGFGADAVWWLDDLERFLDQMGGIELAILLDHGLTVVATLREARWQALLRAGGEEGERGRRLRAAATVFWLPTELSGVERAQAAQTIPRLDLSRGLGEALAADAERAVPRRSGGPTPAARARDPVAMLLLAGTVAAAAALGLVIASRGFSPVKPPPVAVQIAAVRSRAAAEGKTTILARLEHLRGADQESWLFVLRPVTHGSDELRIYEVVDGLLQLRFDSEPLTGGERGPLYVQPQEQQRTAQIDYGLKNLQAVDLFGNGEQELIADYEQLSLGAFEQLPIIVAWDDLAQRYRLTPVLTEPPPLAAGYPPDASQGAAYLMRDTRTRTPLRMWAVAGYLVIPGTGPASATLAIANSTSSASGRSGLLINTYDVTVSAARVTITLHCTSPNPPGQVILTTADPQPILRMATGRGLARLHPIFAPTNVVCVA
jgi:hypothetical protein